MENKEVRTRFAPSPTGFLHAGNYRTALFCYVFAMQKNGKFIVRIEDTDKARSKVEYENNILETLSWLGLKYSALYHQSERSEIYKKYINALIEDGKAYISNEETENEIARDKTGGKKVEAKRNREVIRFKNPNKKVSFQDLIRGRVEFDTTELGDFVIARSIDEPVFHLAVVVDDFEMEITHVLRGEDHISNTPRHILIQEAIGAPTPLYAHLPLVLASDRSKLSKRRGAIPITDYRDRGYLPEAIINFMALLGWNPGTEKEIFSLDELIKEFKLEKVQKSGAIFDEKKLRWINKEHIKIMANPESRIEPLLLDLYPDADSGTIKRLVPALIERIETFGDIEIMKREGELDYFFSRPAITDAKKISWKGETAEDTKKNLSESVKLLLAIREQNFSAEEIKSRLWPYAEKMGKGNVLWPIRYCLSGREKSPDPFELAYILGKNETIARIKNTLQSIN